jgi:hypothetical protein
MSTGLHARTRDVTAIVRQAQPTSPTAHYLLWMCGHKGPRLGALLRRGIPRKCAACNTKGQRNDQESQDHLTHAARLDHGAF